MGATQSKSGNRMQTCLLSQCCCDKHIDYCSSYFSSFSKPEEINVIPHCPHCLFGSNEHSVTAGMRATLEFYHHSRILWSTLKQDFFFLKYFFRTFTPLFWTGQLERDRKPKQHLVFAWRWVPTYTDREMNSRGFRLLLSTPVCISMTILSFPPHFSSGTAIHSIKCATEAWERR